MKKIKISRKIKNRFVFIISILTIIVGVFFIYMNQTKTITGFLPLDVLIAWGILPGLGLLLLGLASISELFERVEKSTKPRR